MAAEKNTNPPGSLASRGAAGVDLCNIPTIHYKSILVIYSSNKARIILMNEELVKTYTKPPITKEEVFCE